MKEYTLLSVVVANCNNQQYIGDCFDSILEQSYPNIEIIVVDDCSTDNSPAIIREYAARYPEILKPFFNSSNRGVAFTRHRAIRETAGEYVTTLDGDDYYYHRQKLAEEMALVLRAKQRDGKDIVSFSNIALVKPDKRLIQFFDQIHPIREGHIFEEILGRSCMIPRDFVMSKELYFEVGGYDCSLPIFEDWDLKIRLSRDNEFYYTRIPGTAYRRHGKGLSAKPREEIIHWLTIVFEKNISLAERNIGEITRQFREFLSGID